MLTPLDEELARLRYAEHRAWAANASRWAHLTLVDGGPTRPLLAGLARWLARRWWVPTAPPVRASDWRAQSLRCDAD